MKLHLKKIFQITASIAIFTVLIIQTGKNISPASANIIANVHGAIWSFMPTGSDECITGFNTSGSLPCANGIIGNGTNSSSGQGLGWAFMNSLDDTSSTVPYGVSLDVTTGALSGYAWSSDEGTNPGDLPGGFWINFAPIGPYPQFSGVTDGPARIEPTCYASATTTACPLIGWIRYMPGEIANTDITGGWDGWVSLNGQSKVPPYSYSVIYNKLDGTFMGDAWGDKVAGWVRFPRTLSTVHVKPLQCPASADRFATMIEYYPGQPLPAGCEAQQVVDLCTNVAGIQGSLPWQDPVTLVSYMQYPNDPVGICKKVTVNTCIDKNADNYGGTLPCTYDPDICKLKPSLCNGGGSFCKEHPELCEDVDLCQPPAADALGDQLGTGPWQVSGTWYGLSGGMCQKSVCSNYPDATHTDSFYATAPFGESELPDGTCGKPSDWCKENPEKCEPSGTGGTLKPIYKEN